jgi:hypothetical protein
MPIQYYLAENLLTPDPNDYVAKATNVRSYTLEEIIDRMASKGMTLTKVDITAALQAYHDEIGAIIADGNAVNTPLFNAQPSITGVFNDINDGYDAARHKIKLNLSGGMVIKTAIERVAAHKVAAPAQGTQITAIIDKTSNSTNDQLTANAAIEITGTKIKVTDEEEAGVFFIAADGATSRAAMMITNNPSSLIVMTPNLESGKYMVEVRTYYSGSSTPLKTLRIARSNKTFTVR